MILIYRPTGGTPPTSISGWIPSDNVPTSQEHLRHPSQQLVADTSRSAEPNAVRPLSATKTSVSTIRRIVPGLSNVTPTTSTQPAQSPCPTLKMRTPFRTSFVRSCRWSCKRESSGKPPASSSTRSRSRLRTSSAWSSRSRNQSRLSSILTRYRKLPWPPPARLRAKLQPARPQQMAVKKLARSTPRPAKTFRPAQSRPVIAQDHKPRIALAKVTRDGSNM